MAACSSWWQPAVFVTCVSSDKTAKIRWICRGSTVCGISRTRWTDCRTVARLGYRSLWVQISDVVNGRKIISFK